MLFAPAEEDLSSGSINQCQTCGKLVNNGKIGLKAHEKTHEGKSKPKLTSLCHSWSKVLLNTPS